MATLKTQPTKASVAAFIKSVEDEQKQQDCRTLVKLMQAATGKKPRMWGDSIVGFGNYHYKYASGREGDWFVTGFSPRKQNLTIYIMPGFKPYQKQLKTLGKNKTSVSCLYIKSLDRLDLDSLQFIIEDSVKRMRDLYECH